MQSTQLTHAVVFATVLPTLLVAHNVADHWIQTSHQATVKGFPGWRGRWACARHVATYTATTALAVAGVTHLLGLTLHPGWFAAGQAVSAVTHYIVDRRTPLMTLCRAAERIGLGGKTTFAHLGAPRPSRDDNPTLGTGAYALDQSWHHAWLLVAALLTTVGAR